MNTGKSSTDIVNLLNSKNFDELTKEYLTVLWFDRFFEESRRDFEKSIIRTDEVEV